MRSTMTPNGSAKSGGLESFFGQLEDEAEAMGDSRIIDLTAQADKSRRIRTRDPKKVYALVLHQMACCFKVRDPLKRFLKMAPHFAILPDGRILQLHPILSLTGASKGFNAGSVAVEFAGNFPDARGKWWHGDENGRNQVTPAQIEAGRYLVRHLIRTMGLRVIVAHRQSSGTRDNDPGPDIWYNVGQWAIDTLGLKDGGPGFKIGTGNAIPDIWRKWGQIKPQQAPTAPAPSAATPTADTVRFAQRVLNATEATRLADDGNLGRLTRAALTQFRERYKLGSGGVLDGPTELALAQRALEELAQQSIFPQLGVLDTKTGPAIARFKSERGLGFDATIDAATRRALADALVRRTAPAPSGGGSSAPPAPATRAPTSPAPSTNGGGGVGDVPSGPFGTLTVTAPERYRFSYPLTGEDASWVARLITGEAGGRNDLDGAAVIWAMFNRFALFTHRGSYWMKQAGLRGYATLADFVQAYSTTLQPVLKSVGAAKRSIERAQQNPAKFQYVQTGGVYPGTSIPRGQLKHHLDRIQKLRWSRLPQETRDIVLAAFSGTLRNPVGLASQFANTATYYYDAHKRQPDQAAWREFTLAHARKKKWTWVDNPSLSQFKSNVFFVDNRVKDLPFDTVRVGKLGAVASEGPALHLFPSQ